MVRSAECGRTGLDKIGVMSMAGSTIEVQKKGESYTVSISGPIDEDISFENATCPGASEIIVNFQKVNVIKSFGIREFMRWIETQKNPKLIFSFCPKIIVDQINIVDGFLPANGRVDSFYVPYYCEDSGEESVILFRYGVEFSDNKVNAPTEIFDSKGNKMDIDVVWNKYFRFLENGAKKKIA